MSLLDSPTPNYSTESINILRLIRSENVGIKTFYNLLDFFGNATTAIDKIKDLAKEGGKKTAIKVCSVTEAEQEIVKHNKLNARLITYRDPEYSKLLLEITDPPPVISCLGNSRLFNTKSMAIVGARNASLNGLILTKKMAEELCQHKMIIVSGLARGIDTAAHKASINTGTIAVLAGGIDYIYPPENKDLYHRIAKEGLVIAELPIGTAPLSRHFPQRNRLISGLCVAVLVVEANLKSGSLVTARFALEQDREVFAVPGFPLDPRSQGTNKLIKEGAHLVESIEDILTNLPVDMTKRPIHLEEVSTQIPKFPDYLNMDQVTNDMRDQVFNLLSTTPVDLERLIQALELPLPTIYLIILELELAGKVIRTSGNKISVVHEQHT